MNWLKLALKVALKGKHDSHLLGAVIVRGGCVLSTGANLSRPYGELNGGSHAEIRAIRPHHDYRGATIIVARHGSKMSRPCPKCIQAIREAGIRNMVYHNWEGEPTVERV